MLAKIGMTSAMAIITIGGPMDFFLGWPVNGEVIFALAMMAWGVGFMGLLWRF